MRKINSNFAIKGTSSYPFKEQKENVHPLELTPAKYHKMFFAEISSMKISYFKSPRQHLPVQNQQ